MIIPKKGYYFGTLETYPKYAKDLSFVNLIHCVENKLGNHQNDDDDDQFKVDVEKERIIAKRKTQKLDSSAQNFIIYLVAIDVVGDVATILHIYLYTLI